MNCLSTRERQVLELIAFEYTAKQIAQKLFISQHTVDSHRKKLFEKLGAKNTAGLVRRAYETGCMKSPFQQSLFLTKNLHHENLI